MNYSIRTYQSIEQLFDDITVDDHIIMPVGYVNRNSDEMRGWIDFHFRYHAVLHSRDLFMLDTLKMAVLENVSYSINKAVLQSCTYQIFKLYVREEIDIDYAPSKSEALSLFLQKSYRYVICSEDEIISKGSTVWPYNIIKTVCPKMFWVVYTVTG